MSVWWVGKLENLHMQTMTSSVLESVERCLGFMQNP
jgi:hypothetical protein